MTKIHIQTVNNVAKVLENIETKGKEVSFQLVSYELSGS